jgi:flagellar hook-associated protein 1 FlgK
MSVQSLNNALSGLKMAQQQLGVISNNVANVNTEGYTRKILPQSTRVVASTGDALGVKGDAIIRNVDVNLARDLWTQISATSALEVRQSYLSKVEAFHGPPDAEISVAAELAELRDDIAALADDPNDSELRSIVVSQAQTVAKRFNDFGTLVTNLRNDAQDEIEITVDKVNGLLEQIADLNTQIRSAQLISKSAVNLEDLRDAAVAELSEELDISTFTRSDGVMVVQTANGVLLADDDPVNMYFDPNTLGATSFYPNSAAGLYNGNPVTDVEAVDISQDNLGGRLGELFNLRDNTLLDYQAQIDELAHKTALRFEAQGLLLYTDGTGSIPADTPPDLGTTPNTTPVPYVGFASNIQVNEAIVLNNQLLQTGTYTSDKVIPPGSSEVLDRVLEYTFSDVYYQEAVGTVNLVTGALDLQEHLGIYSQNLITLGPDLTQYSELDSGGGSTSDIATLLSEFVPGYPADDEFRIQLYDRGDAAVPVTIDIDISTIGTDPTYAIGAADPSGTLSDGTIDNALDQLVSYINNTIIAEEALLNIPTDIQARAGINASGQLTMQSRGDIEFITTGFANQIGDDTFEALLGTSTRYFETQDPYFDVQVGTSDPVRITIAPGEDENDLLAKLEKLTTGDAGVEGLLVNDVAFAGGTLSLRPGQDETGLAGPVYGGGLKLVAGLGTADGTGASGALAGENILQALFGSASPISDVDYGSETSQTLGVGSGSFVAFRSDYLGQGTNKTAGITSGSNILDYAQKLVANQAQDVVVTESSLEDETTLKDILDTRLKNESGVNLDEELSNLILVQTAYSAAARALTAINDIFDELLAAVR